jgi:ribosomal protein S18 acetylase RimI-like enzyme
MHIRPATLADASRLAEFARRTFAEAFAADNNADDMARYLEEAFSLSQQSALLEDPCVKTLLGEDTGELVAYSQIRQGEIPTCVHAQRPLELWRFYVDAKWHGRGVAHALMDAVVQTSTSLAADSVWLGVWERNTRAIAFYQKHGFEHVGAHDFVLGSDRQTDWIMARPLVPSPGAASL